MHGIEQWTGTLVQEPELFGFFCQFGGILRFVKRMMTKGFMSWSSKPLGLYKCYFSGLKQFLDCSKI